MESPPPSFSCIGGDNCAPTAKSLVVNDTTLLAMERPTSAFAIAAAALARRVPNDRDDATAAVDKMDGPSEALATLRKPVAALCTVKGLWDLLLGWDSGWPTTSAEMLNSSLFKIIPASSTTPPGRTSSSDAREGTRVIPKLSVPRVVDVTTVEAIVALVTLVGKLDIPSVSPRTARVEIP